MDLILIIAGMVVIGLPLLGIFYEQFALIRNRRLYSAPGEMVTVNGRGVHVIRQGERPAGMPAVILEAGTGGNSLDWSLVTSEIAEETAVLAYDRAGYGWSESSADVMTPENIARDLHALLQEIDLAPPYILVGHSFGGFFVRQYQMMYPEEVAGLVLVDAAHPDMLTEASLNGEIQRLRNVDRFKFFGVMRPVVRGLLRDRAENLPETEKNRFIAMNIQDSAMVIKEAVALRDHGLSLPGDVGDLPLTVISRGIIDDPDEGDTRWREQQDDLLTLSTRSRHLVTERASHFIALVHPEVVTDAIREMLATVTETQTTGEAHGSDK